MNEYWLSQKSEFYNLHCWMQLYYCVPEWWVMVLVCVDSIISYGVWHCTICEINVSHWFTNVYDPHKTGKILLIGSRHTWSILDLNLMGDPLKVMRWRWCTEGDALEVMHWKWCTYDDALMVMHWWWCTCGDALVLMHWCWRYNCDWW